VTDAGSTGGRDALRILAINPGSTSTRVALFVDAAPAGREEIRHPSAELARFRALWDQLPWRLEAVLGVLARMSPGARDAVAALDLDAVVGRGGLLRPLPAGAFGVDAAMLADARRGIQGEHAANLGVALAAEVAGRAGVPALTVDPVSVDERPPEARFSGLAGVERRGLAHNLSVRAAVRALGARLGRPWREVRAVVAHLGGGISVCPVADGRILDANNAVSEGPFSPERSGGLPVQELLDLVYSGRFDEPALRRLTVGEGGMKSYVGTADAAEVERRIADGDAEARLVCEAMAYQVAREIGGMATVLRGRLDAVILTGGLARWERLVSAVRGRVEFLAPVHRVDGAEMEALAAGAAAALRGEEPLLDYAREADRLADRSVRDRTGEVGAR
jgi:butyrate kinase